METGLRVATTSRTLLLEPLPASHPGQKTPVLSNQQTEDDNMSSVCEFTALPRIEPKVRFLTDQSESEKTGDEGSFVDCPSLYGRNPIDFESGTGACDESDANFSLTRLNRPSTSASKGPDDNLPELSGRSRAILKSYFLDTDAFNLPRGHPTVAFAEPQVYQLVRVLSDETLKMSYAIMERMVIDAVRSTHTTVPSRTAHFQSMGQAKTPGRWTEPESSASESNQVTIVETRVAGASSSEDAGHSSFDGGSDSATEMALISYTFKSASGPSQVFPAATASQPEQTTDHSSQDTALHERQE